MLGWMLLGFSVSLTAGSIPTTKLPKLRSAAVLVKDQRSGEFLVSKQADVAMPIASLTKLMTAMCILDAHLDMDEASLSRRRTRIRCETATPTCSLARSSLVGRLYS